MRNTVATASMLVANGDYFTASGVLERMNDIDAFKFD